MAGLWNQPTLYRESQSKKLKINYKRLSRTNYYPSKTWTSWLFQSPNFEHQFYGWFENVRPSVCTHTCTHFHRIPLESEHFRRKVKKTVRDYPVDRSVNVDDTFGERIGQVAAVEDDSVYLLSLSPPSPLPLPASAG